MRYYAHKKDTRYKSLEMIRTPGETSKILVQRESFDQSIFNVKKAFSATYLDIFQHQNK